MMKVISVKKTGPERVRVKFEDGTERYRVVKGENVTWYDIGDNNKTKVESKTQKKCESLYKKFKGGK
jgi:hypothetical protein